MKRMTQAQTIRELIKRGIEEEEAKKFYLRDANLRDANLRDANLRDADLRDADLRDADLRDANLRDANLGSANLRGADLRDADLRDANLKSADLRDANLKSADLRDANLKSADLRDANLKSAYLGGANLKSAYLGSAGLRDADLRDANLKSADLRDADLRDANLRDANLKSAYLRGVKNFNYQPDLYVLKQQRPDSLLQAFKFLHKDLACPYQNYSYAGKIGQWLQLETNDYSSNELNQCDKGFNVATMEWCKNNKGKHDIVFRVEFYAGDIVAIPLNTDGKFRVKKMRIIGEYKK